MPVMSGYGSDVLINRQQLSLIKNGIGGRIMLKNDEKKPKKNVVRAKKVDPSRDFELLSETAKGKKPRPYSMSGLFKTGDVIDHNIFGMGIVISALNKQMEVVFSDHPRILVFDRDL